MHIPVHSPWLPGYITQTILIICNNGWTFSGQTLYMIPQGDIQNAQHWQGMARSLHQGGSCALEQDPLTQALTQSG